MSNNYGVIFLTLTLASNAQAADSRWLDNTRLALDLAVRGIYEQRSDNFDGIDRKSVV